MEIAISTGIMLDLVYTIKAVRGMLGEMKKNPARFKGNRVLFVHTGRYSNMIASYLKCLFMPFLT